MHPTELAYPCCLPALGELGKLSPHEGLTGSIRPAAEHGQAPGGRGEAGQDFDSVDRGDTVCDGGFA